MQYVMDIEVERYTPHDSQLVIGPLDVVRQQPGCARQLNWKPPSSKLCYHFNTFGIPSTYMAQF